MGAARLGMAHRIEWELVLVMVAVLILLFFLLPVDNYSGDASCLWDQSSHLRVGPDVHRSDLPLVPVARLW